MVDKEVSMKRLAFCELAASLSGPIECTNFVYLIESQALALVTMSRHL